MLRPNRFIDATLTGYALTFAFSLVASQAACILSGVVWLGSMFRSHNRRGVRLPLIWPMAAFLVASLLAAALALDPWLAFRDLRSAWVPIVLFFVVVNHLRTEARGRRLVRLLVAAGALAALYGISPVVVHGTDFRVRGAISHYMTFAGLLMIVALLGVAQLLFRWRGRRDAGWVLAVGLILTALALTQTRSAWIGLGIGLVVLVWCWRPVFLVALPVLAVIAFLLAPATLQERVRHSFDPNHPSTTERAAMWRAGLDILIDHPLTGVGPDNVETIYEDYRYPADNHVYMHLHNNLVQIAAHRGVLGLAAWLSIWVFYFILAVRAWRAAADADARARVAGSLAAVAAFLVAGIFECNYRDTEVTQLLHATLALPFIRSPS